MYTSIYIYTSYINPYIYVRIHPYTSIHLYLHLSVHICPVRYTILLYSSVWVYEKNSLLYISTVYINAYLQGIILIKEALSGLEVVKVTGLSMTTSSSVPGGPGVLTASSNRLSSSQFLLVCVTSSKAAATKAVRSKVCLGGTGGCRGGGDTLSVSGVYGVPLPETIWLV